MKPSYGLTDEEVERMLLDSFEHAEADFAARLLIEARNEAETVITRHREVAAVAGVRRRSRRAELAPGEQKRIEQALAGLKTVLGSAGPRGDSAVDAGAERRDAAPGRGDDEPQRAGRAGGEEHRRALGCRLTACEADA